MAGKSLIQQAQAKPGQATASLSSAAKQNVGPILNGILDGEGYRKRFDEILGQKAPQFISSVVTMASNDAMLAKVVASAPQTIITSALQAAALDLPINPQLGTAYVVPFKNKVKKPDGTEYWRDEATMIIGWKGLVQLAQRTGLYKKINADFIYEGERIVNDRITGDVHIEGEKTSEKVIGYLAYFQLINGFEKCVCWTREKAVSHEAKNRKGQYQSKAWRDDFDSMALKSVVRNLISKWGPMSIDYHTAPPEMASAAESLQDAVSSDDDMTIDGDGVVFEDAAPIADPETGEIKTEQQQM